MFLFVLNRRCSHVCVGVSHTVAGPLLESPPLFQRWDGWPDSHHKHNERENLAGLSGLLMIHVFISYLPSSTPFSSRHPAPIFLSTPFNKKDVCLVLGQQAHFVPCQHTA